jgi:anti-sigma B factor antagonist
MPREGHKQILINFAETTHVDSSGLGVLVGAFASITNQGGQMKLLNLTKRVKDILLVTKLFTVFEVFDDETLAVRSFAEAVDVAPAGTRA